MSKHFLTTSIPWFCLFQVVEKNKELEAIWRTEALKGMLKEMHSLFLMFNGTIRVMLDEDSSGALVRSHLFTFFTDYLFGKI